MPKKKNNDFKNYIDLFIIPKDKLFFLAVYRKIKAQSRVARSDECDIRKRPCVKLSIIAKYKLYAKISRSKRFMRFELKVDGISKLNFYPLCAPLVF